MKKTITFLLLFISSNLYGKQIRYAIPFELYENRILISGKIDNIKCKFLFDTGAAFSSIEESFLKKFKINTKRLNLVLEGGFEIKNHALKSQNIKKFDLNAKHSSVIGLDFFAEYNFEIDYANRKIKLYDPKDDITDHPDSVELSRHTTNLYLYNFFYINAEIRVRDTTIKGDFLIDTGSGGTITLLNYDDKYAKLNSEIRGKGKHIAITMSNADHFLMALNHKVITRNTEFLFGNKKFKNQIVDISNVTLRDFKGNSFVGIIGGGFLQQFKLFMDSDKDHLLIIASEQDDPIENNLFTDGFKFIKKKKKVMISAICSTSASPIELGDEILEVNGIAIPKIDLEILRADKRKLGNTFNYKIKRGDHIFYHQTEVVDFYEFL